MSMQGWMNETRINVDRMPGWIAIAIVAQVWMYEWRSSFGQDECWVYGVIAICTGVWEFTDCYFCTWMLVCTILCTTVFEPVCPIVFTDRFRICDLPILCSTILHLPMWWTVCMLYVVSYWCDAAIAQIQTNFSPGRHNKLTWLDMNCSLH